MLTKNQMVDLFAEETGLTKMKSRSALNFLFEMIGKKLVDEKKVLIPLIGSFQLRPRSAYKGRNPATGQEIMIPAKTVILFKASKTLKDQIV